MEKEGFFKDDFRLNEDSSDEELELWEKMKIGR